MKLRTDGRSIRLRLRRSEVAQFGESGRIAVQLAFPGACLDYSLEAADVPEVTVFFQGGHIQIAVPRAIALHWTASDEVGIYGVHNSIAIVIEKDFRRTARATPDDPDLYPNPRAGTGARENNAIEIDETPGSAEPAAHEP